MALPTLTKTLDDLHSSTWERVKTDVVDNIFDANPILKLMKARGKFIEYNGGTDILQPLEYGENETVDWIGRGSKVSIETGEIITAAKYQWKYMAGSVVRIFTDEDMNSGEPAIFNYTEKNISNLEKSMKKKINAALMKDGSQHALAMSGFKKYVQATPATGTVGGIDASTEPWWRNQHAASSGDHTVYMLDDMRDMYDDCSDDGGTETPQVILTTKVIKNWYEDEALDSHYYTQSNELADLGIKGCAFKGAPILWSKSCTDYYMYFLNLDYFEIAYTASKWFEMTEWKTAQDNLERVAQVVAKLQLICSNREKQGLISSIDE